ncbi:MAG: hypothetical protein GEU83_11195 [Pseudonocardiaceae bacterium]|nr:hypothetical protein [Pseudonocardiaceae bacterium]
MLFLITLTIGTALAAALQGARRSARSAARVGLAIAMVVAGVSHWLNPVPFQQHLPPWGARSRGADPRHGCARANVAVNRS